MKPYNERESSMPVVLRALCIGKVKVNLLGLATTAMEFVFFWLLLISVCCCCLRKHIQTAFYVSERSTFDLTRI